MRRQQKTLKKKKLLHQKWKLLHQKWKGRLKQRLPQRLLLSLKRQKQKKMIYLFNNVTT